MRADEESRQAFVDIWCCANLVEYMVARAGDVALCAEVLPQIGKIKAFEKELEVEVDALHEICTRAAVEM